jgi:hypothetical protein
MMLAYTSRHEPLAWLQPFDSTEYEPDQASGREGPCVGARVVRRVGHVEYGR